MVTVDTMSQEFMRIIKKIKEPNPVNTQILKIYSSELSRLQTPSIIVSYMHDKKIRRSRKIKVQPLFETASKTITSSSLNILLRRNAHTISL